jgi:cytochrome d ubiquinol oxidase subunit I
MDELLLARAQFAITCIYHFFFVPLTLGLSLLVALMETAYVRTGNEQYKRMTKFWGKLFIINFAMGVVTGIVMEFQFGMNWSEYSRFVGDIFGAPLAIEALLAFFLESTFIGVWVFGWDKLSKGTHAVVMWLVVIGSNLSALWILIANSFMQHPVGFEVTGGRAEMTDFGALLTNPYVWHQFPHVIASGMSTGAFFVLGISAWRLMRVRSGGSENGEARALFGRSFRWGAVYGLIGVFLVVMLGHSQMQYMVKAQPMKVAAAEALWESEDPASLSLFTIGDEKNREDVFAIRIPKLLSLLSYNRLDGEVKGINDLQAEYAADPELEARYGDDMDYVPPVALSYWSFRAMVGAGLLMLALALAALYYIYRDTFAEKRWLMRALMWAIALPYVANTTGWMLTELGRQPWIVYGYQTIEEAVSPNVGVAELLVSLVLFIIIYGVLIFVDAYLLRKYAGVDPTAEPDETGPALEATL